MKAYSRVLAILAALLCWLFVSSANAATPPSQPRVRVKATEKVVAGPSARRALSGVNAGREATGRAPLKRQDVAWRVGKTRGQLAKRATPGAEESASAVRRTARPLAHPHAEDASVAKPALHLALGLAVNNPYVRRTPVIDFAKENGFKHYGDLHDNVWSVAPKTIVANVTKAMKEADTIHFTLFTFDMKAFKKYLRENERPTISHGNSTNWELHTILTSPELLKKTVFYDIKGNTPLWQPHTVKEQVVAAPNLAELKAEAAKLPQ